MNSFSLAEEMNCFAEPIESDPEKKLRMLLLSIHNLEAREMVLDTIFDMVRDHPDISRVVVIGKETGCRVYG